MNKSDISQYCSGKAEPNQSKLFVLGAALNVSEGWLMGYDVPMERGDKNSRFKEYVNKTNAFELQLNAFGWKCEFFDCYDWYLINSGFGINNDGEWVDGGKGYPSGCKHPDGNSYKCNQCSYYHPHYRFSNGNISFNVSLQDYEIFCNDVETFYKTRIQKLIRMASQESLDNQFLEQEAQIPDSSAPVYTLNAAHERTDIKVTDEMRRQDDDTMNDDSQW